MYENYLLNPRAIAAVANGIEGFRQPQVREEEVQQMVDAMRTDRQYYCPAIQSIPNNWLDHIDGASVLREIFADLWQHRVARYQEMNQRNPVCTAARGVGCC